MLDSFLKPRAKAKQPQFGLYLDEEIKDAVQLAEKISQPPPSSSPAAVSKAKAEVTHTPLEESAIQTEMSQLVDNLSDSVEDTVTETVQIDSTVRHADPQPRKRADGKNIRQVKRQAGRQVNSHIDYWLTPNQFKVLQYLYNLKPRVACVPDIMQQTDIPYGTVRGCLRTLVELDCITKPKYVRKGNFRGFSYAINELRCEEFLNRQASKQVKDQVNRQVVGELNDQVDLEPIIQEKEKSSNFLNKLIKNNPDSASSLLDSISEVLATHPELGYWRQKKLTPQQVQKWMEMTGASLESMVQSLCHCRYEMVELNQEEEKNIQNVFNWFYRIIERAGFYPKPKGYQSYLERQLEIEKKLLAEKQERLKALAELQRQKKEAERDIAFYEMLSQPDSELYQQCFSRLNKFTQATKNASLFERFMRDAFDQILDEQEQQALAEARQGGDGAGRSGGDGRGS